MNPLRTLVGTMATLVGAVAVPFFLHAAELWFWRLLAYNRYQEALPAAIAGAVALGVAYALSLAALRWPTRAQRPWPEAVVLAAGAVGANAAIFLSTSMGDRFYVILARTLLVSAFVTMLLVTARWKAPSASGSAGPSGYAYPGQYAAPNAPSADPWATPTAQR